MADTLLELKGEYDTFLRQEVGEMLFLVLDRMLVSRLFAHPLHPSLAL